MNKIIFSYLFSIIILGSIVTPTYIHFSDFNMEVTQVVDLGEEEENKGQESLKDLEIKIYYSENNEAFEIGLQKKLRMSFYSKNYFFKLNKLNSPPPEQSLA